jgi:hypothetical protein
MMPIDQAQDSSRLLTTDLLAVDCRGLIEILETGALQTAAFPGHFSGSHRAAPD